MKFIKLASQSVAVIAAAVALSTPSSAAPNCRQITGGLNVTNNISCTTGASGRFAGNTGSKSVLADLISGSQLDTLGVTPTGKLLSLTCKARDKTTTGVVISPTNSCIPKPGESWTNVLGTLYQ